MQLARRSFLTGLIAAPIIVQSGLIMPIRPLRAWWNDKLVPLPPGEYRASIDDYELVYDAARRTILKISGTAKLENGYKVRL